MQEHSDDNFSDEELEIDSHNFNEILKTRMGVGGKKKHDQDHSDLEKNSEDAKVPESTLVAFTSAQNMWQIPSSTAKTTRISTANVSMESLEKAFAAAALSQKQEYGNTAATDKIRHPSPRSATDYTPHRET